MISSFRLTSKSTPPFIFLCHWKPARMTMAGCSLLPELHYTALQTPSGCYSVEIPLNSWFSCWVISLMRRCIAFGRQSPVMAGCSIYPPEMRFQESTVRVKLDTKVPPSCSSPTLGLASASCFKKTVLDLSCRHPSWKRQEGQKQGGHSHYRCFQKIIHVSFTSLQVKCYHKSTHSCCGVW